MKRLGKLSCMVAAITIMGCWSVPALAQTGGDAGTPTANPGTQQPVQQPQQPTQQPNTFEQGQQGDFQTGGAFDFQNLVDQLTVPEIPEFENARNQPFVGRSLQRFDVLGIRAHPRSNIETAGASSSGGGGRVTGGRAGNNRQQGLQGGGNNNIIRKSLRTRLVPKIVVRNPVTAQQVSTRFQQRISGSQNLADGGSGVRIRVENKTAYLTGVVTSQDERNRVERMARLEPGIYRIDNKIQVQP